MSVVRPAAVAGYFYPDAPAALRELVRSCLRAAEAEDPGEPADPGRRRLPPKAIIVPHAGFAYSGSVAAAAYRLLEGAAIRRVVLLGPAHRVAVRGLALPTSTAFATPLGMVPIDVEAAVAARQLPQVMTSDAAHANEHALEVQLPFLQSVLPAFRLVPFVVGDASPDEVAQVIDRLWGDAETLVVASSDLSHFHDDATARRVDAETTARVLAGTATLDGLQACGAAAINGLLLAAGARGLHARLLQRRSSADAGGDASRVVGYASFAFEAAGNADVRH